MYTTNVRPESEVKGSLPLIIPSQKCKGFISGKLPMTEDEGRIFVEYTVIAVIHMIYTKGMSY